MKLTSRDKVLLYLLAIIIILVGGVKFLIIPIYEGYNTSKLEAENIDFEAKNIELGLSTLDSEEKILDKAEKDFISNTKGYSQYMSTKEITDYMNKFIIENSLSASSFSATDTEKVGGVDSNLFVYSSTITLEVSGTYANLRSFIDSAYKNKTLIITYFNLISDGVKLDSTDTASMEIEIVLYMYDMRWSEE